MSIIALNIEGVYPQLKILSLIPKKLRSDFFGHLRCSLLIRQASSKTLLMIYKIYHTTGVPIASISLYYISFITIVITK